MGYAPPINSGKLGIFGGPNGNHLSGDEAQDIVADNSSPICRSTLAVGCQRAGF